MKIPSADNAEESEMALASSPTIIGMIALRTTGMFHPVPTNPFFTWSTVDQSEFRRRSPSSDWINSIAAVAAAAVAGVGAVEKMKERALLTSSSISFLDPQI